MHNETIEQEYENLSWLHFDMMQKERAFKSQPSDVSYQAYILAIHDYQEAVKKFEEERADV